MTDWLFDEAAVSRELSRFVAEAEDALVRARAALERRDDDAPSERDRAALLMAIEVVDRARARLAALDHALLADAHDLLAEVRERSEPAPVRVAHSA